MNCDFGRLSFPLETEPGPEAVDDSWGAGPLEVGRLHDERAALGAAILERDVSPLQASRVDVPSVLARPPDPLRGGACGSVACLVRHQFHGRLGDHLTFDPGGAVTLHD